MSTAISQPISRRLSVTGWLVWPETKKLLAAFDAAGKPLRFVGGAVRDALLGREVSDVDAATPAPPQKVMAILEAAGIKAVPTGMSHGTVTAIVDGKPFEITTLRRDVQTHGRHADVWFTDSWEEDAARRDFTINAIYCSGRGELFDYFDGVQDAEAGRVLFIGDPERRIREDGLRILRFFRFHAHYGRDNLDEEGLSACHDCRDMLAKLSGERVSQEMLRLLEADEAPELVEIMRRAELLDTILPGLPETRTLQAWPRVRLMADVENDAAISLALLLRSAADPEAALDALIKRWRLSNKFAERLKQATQFTSLDAGMSEAQRKIMLRHSGVETYRDRVLISWTERLAESPDASHPFAAAYRTLLALPERWTVPDFPVTGADLQQQGMTSGPEIGYWLKRLENWWEREGYAPDRQALLDYWASQQ